MRISFSGGRRARAFWIGTVAAWSFLGLPQLSAAQTGKPTAAPSPADLEQRVKELENQVDNLNRETRDHEVAIDNQKRFPLAQWRDGFVISSADNAYKLKIGGYTQFDGRFFASDKDQNNTDQFLFRRVRPILEGTVAKYFDFKIMPDFAPANFALFDAYVDVNYFAPYTRLRFGKYKTPLGLERLQSATAIILMERGQPTNLVPTRDLGVDLWGDLVDGIFNYRLGIYDGAPDLANPTGDFNDDFDFDGRLFVSPFKTAGIPALEGFSAGIGGSYGYSKGSNANPDLTAGYRSFGQATIFRYSTGTPASGMNPAIGPAIATGTRARINPSVYYYWGPFGALAEYVSSIQGVAFNGKQDNVDNEAWMLGATYLLTGEAASYKGANPAEPVDPWEGKWGAWEVVARISQLHIDNSAFALGAASSNNSVNEDLELAFGLNWYLNRNIKFVTNFAWSQFDGGKPNGGDREPEYEIGGRLQLLL